VIKSIKCVVVAVLIVVPLGGCSLIQNELFTESFWSGSPIYQNNQAELGVAELAKGNYVTAEGLFLKALKVNPRDIDALIGSGILYQNTGQLTKARQMYEAVLALRPDDSHQFIVWNKLTTRPTAQIASINLSLLETGGMIENTPMTPMPMPGVVPTPAAQSTLPVNGVPTTLAMLGRPQQANLNSITPAGTFAGEDKNTMSRFSTLRALKEQRLLTEAEYNQRRLTNIGALLPLTSPPPAAGLERSVPSSEQISGRLHAIGRALEMRAISVSQHAAEREMILDALMPSAPIVVANPGAPPRELMQAADSVRRLEKLKSIGFIDSNEYDRERQAIELSMRPTTLPSPKKTLVLGTQLTKPVALDKKPNGPKPGVHLASYRSQKQAERGWAQIRKAHSQILGDLSHEVTRVSLGRKGTYYRLKVGPVLSNDDARSLCKKLKRRRQFCEPSIVGTI
jgi:tetratricopeptide (TPR) repeat protein